LLHALVTTGTSTLHLPATLHDPAEGLLALFGAKLSAEPADEMTRLALDGVAPLRAQALAVPGDPRLAVYPAVAALVTPDSEITISSVALHPGGLGLLDALALLGGDITIGSARLKAVKRIQRCAATNVDPDTGLRDLAIPKTLLQSFGHSDCGIYAQVVSGGEVAVGDALSETAGA